MPAEQRAQVARYNDDFFKDLGVDRSIATATSRRISDRLGLPTTGTVKFHRLAFAALRISGFFSVHKLAPGGWLFTDDVRFPDNRVTRHRPSTLDVWTVIAYFNARLKDQFRFLLQREEPGSILSDPKYIAYLHKGH